MTTSIAHHHILGTAKTTPLSVEWLAAYQSVLLLMKISVTMFVRLPSCPVSAFLSRSFCMYVPVSLYGFVASVSLSTVLMLIFLSTAEQTAASCCTYQTW